ncbi:MAG: DUF192 domain-containing protein [Pseudomonadales bacterium]|nr:DUF192 domain-containing protein [Pseudomonadales bacterium]
MKVGCIEREYGTTIPCVWLADRWWSRSRGLLWRAPLAEAGSQALMIEPCASVHTFGMGYALDLVFLDSRRRVCGWRERLVPWRAAACRGARTTVEFHAGTLENLCPQMGEAWIWRSVT